MRILIVGTGGVGSAAARIAVRRDFFEKLVSPTTTRPGRRPSSPTSATTGSSPPRWTRRMPTPSPP